MPTSVQVPAAPAVQLSSVEHLYQVHVKLTRVVEFGTALQQVLSGAAPPPACGARFDVHFEGSLSGARLSGTLAGVDYFSLRADGRADLHIHGALTTEDGAGVSLFADGIGVLDLAAGRIHLHEHVTLHSSDERYLWVNALPIVARGTVDLQKMEVEVDGFAT